MNPIHPKVGATVVAGALTGLLIAELNRRGVTIAPDEAADITVILSALAAWLMPGSAADAPAAISPTPPPPAVLPVSPAAAVAVMPSPPLPVHEPPPLLTTQG